MGHRYSKAGAPKTKKQEKDQEAHRSGVKTVPPKQSGNEERCSVLKLQERQADEQIDVTQTQLAWTPIASASSAREDPATAATTTTATTTTPTTTNSHMVRHAKVHPERVRHAKVHPKQAATTTTARIDLCQELYRF